MGRKEPTENSVQRQKRGFGVSVRGFEDMKQECLKLMSTLGFTRV